MSSSNKSSVGASAKITKWIPLYFGLLFCLSFALPVGIFNFVHSLIFQLEKSLISNELFDVGSNSHKQISISGLFRLSSNMSTFSENTPKLAFSCLFFERRHLSWRAMKILLIWVVRDARKRRQVYIKSTSVNDGKKSNWRLLAIENVTFSSEKFAHWNRTSRDFS